MTQLVAVEARLGGDVGEVGAGAGLGVALAPQLLDGHDLRQEALLLLLGAERDQRRAEQLLAEVVDAGGRVGAGVLLVEDHLLEQRQPAAAVLLGPADAGPAVLREVPVPGHALVVRLVLAAGTALAAQLGELAGEVVLQPRADLGAERLVLGTVGEIHADRVTYQALAWYLSATDEPGASMSSSPRTLPALLRAAAEAHGDRAAYVEGGAHALLPRTCCTGSARPRPATARSASAPATGSWSGRRTASTGRSPRWPCRTPAACWCPPTAATPGTRSPTSSSAPHARLVVVADGFLGRTQIADLERRQRPVLGASRSSTSPTWPSVAGRPGRHRRASPTGRRPTTSPTSCSPRAPPAAPRAR